MPNTPKTKVAILGSGCGALSAAFWLTANQALRDRFEVTVYTPGWRIGGKCASGRDDQNRIYEHGLHMLMGFYTTAFHTIKHCYDLMPHAPDDAFKTWDQAFAPQSKVTLWFHLPVAAPVRWIPWTVTFPPSNSSPVDEPLTLRENVDYMDEAAKRVLKLLLDEVFGKLKGLVGDEAWWTPSVEDTLTQYTALLTNLTFIPSLPAYAAGEASGAQVASAGGVANVADLLTQFQTWFEKDVGPYLYDGQNFLAADNASDAGFQRYLYWVLAEVGLSGLIGFWKDVMPYGEQGYERINEYDYKEWLRRHGCKAEASNSPVVMSIYDLAFAYEGGDSSTLDKGQAAAGALLRLLIRMAFAYPGAPLWKMNGGMGDVVFTPLYRRLKDCKVEFRFMHEVTRLAASGGAISEIEYVEQAKTANGAPYEPEFKRVAVPGGKWDCWPAVPDWDQLYNGDVLQGDKVDFENPWDLRHRPAPETLVRGRNFDLVVLGIPPTASQHFTRDLINVSPEWSNMLTHSHSVATRSSQIWLTKAPNELGWPKPTVAVCYEDPLRSWAEMTHLLPFEGGGGAAMSCQYLCGTFTIPAGAPAPGTSDPNYCDGMNGIVRAHTYQWLPSNAPPLWQGLPRPFNPLWIHHEYHRANVQHSERYVQTLPNTVQYRLKPDWRGFSNLYLAGDWTWTSVNGGCAEAAFEAGLRAACAIAGLTAPPVPD